MTLLAAAALAFLTSIGGQAPATASECSKIWVGHAAQIEEFLRTAPIERIEDVPIGVTKPKRAYFPPGSPVASAAWKPLRPGFNRGFMESYKAEIAAYELDKLLGMNMVPPYVYRRVDRDDGTLGLWVENVKGWSIKEPVRGPDPVAWDRQVIRMKMFDQLIGNIDRNQGNLLYDGEYHLILIDHSRAFTSITELKKMAALSRVDAELWDRIMALTEEQVDATLGEWVGKRERKAIFARRDRMKKAIDKLAAERGELAFLR